ncbi:ATP-binding protein [Azospirillum agricola]|uniref:ATP-binding protein n=1 Tax=Azospirillum agricola TaxID=1720247 RepID=UPI000A0F3446|nr:ATP-binding protein [Azospirillum agricola]SMH56895.1 hypothetical protein SAMN02982994_4195 [Azospirillum lipoferum]
MKVGIDMGRTNAGGAATLDLEELLATRLLVQGNSGSGKSHLLRRLIEQSAQWVQQAIIDPEGDFVTLAERFGHVVVEADEHSEAALQAVAARVRQHRVSVVLNLEGLDSEMQMRAAAAFLGGLFDADRDCWYPMLVVVDEAQLFAPSAAGEVSDEARKVSLGAMTNLMCRGRKRGLAGVIATQRLAKLAKNVAAEASNFLMGRTFLDIDMARAADLLGMERRQAEMFRDLERGHFIALGPALSRRPLPLRIGTVETQGRTGSPTLIPPPATPTENARDLIFTATDDEPARYPVRRPSTSASADLMAQLARGRAAAPPPAAVEEETPLPLPEPEETAEQAAEREARYEEVLREVLADPEAPYRPIAVLYQDFLVRCRGRGVDGDRLALPAFRRKLTAARAGAADGAGDDPAWGRALAVAATLTEDIQPVFLLLARAALDHTPCPSDAEVARACGSRSKGRGRRLLTYMEQRGFIATRSGLGNTRAIGLPALGWETALGDPNADPHANSNGGDATGGPSEGDLFAAG